jgi:signal transduction histidine kinase
VSLTTRPRVGRVNGFDVVLIGTVVILAGVNAAMLAFPQLRPRVVAPALDLVLDSIAFVVTAMIAAMTWVRWRERHLGFAVYQSAAFLVLTIANLRAVLETIGPDLQVDLPPVGPGQDQMYVFTAARLLAGVLLVVGGLASLRNHQPGRPRLIVGSSAVLMLAVVVLADLGEAGLTGMVTWIAPSGGVLLTAPAVTPAGAFVQLVSAALYAAAAVVCRALWLRDRSIGDAWITLALVFAAFAQVANTLSASTHPDPVTSGDVLRLTAYLALLLSVEAETGSFLASLRRANQSLDEARGREVERAAFEERALLSRELHDGLAQDLWFAKLKVSRLAALDLSPEARPLVDELSEAIDLGLADARQAVLALRIVADAEGSFGDLITRYVADFEDRFGIRVDCDLPDDPPTLPVRSQAELLRIAQEALMNANRHADATVVRVQATSGDGRFRLSVSDNGRGFDPTVPRTRSFGLVAMRERAALIGADLEIRSAPGDGTRIVVSVPLAPAQMRPVTT